jgi:ATP-binding cassette subfamily C (CFTR/MRP) protein 4
MLVLSAIILTLYLNAWTFIPLIPLIFIFIYIRRYFLCTSIEIKRIEAINRSPILVHVNNTLSGISVIRSSNSSNNLLEEYNAHTDYHTRAVSTFASINRWFAIRLGKNLNIIKFF